MGLFKLFEKKPKIKSVKPFIVDVHSHLLPGIDDGVKDLEDALKTIVQLGRLGYRHLITTPHVYKEFYDNDKTVILEKLKEVRTGLEQYKIPMKIEAAAEYFLDENFLNLLDKKPDELLTFGGNYLLFELSFHNMPIYLQDALVKMHEKGFQPLLAHPERYEYFQSDPQKVFDLLNAGLMMQLNLGSFGEAYGKTCRKFAEKLILHEHVVMIGSDCHNRGQVPFLKKAINNKVYQKALKQKTFLNNALVS